MSSSQSRSQDETATEFSNWCADISDRAVQALSNNQTNPIVSEMAEIYPESASEMKYPCETQEEQDPSYGNAPVSNFSGTTGDNAPDEPDSLVVGYGTIVPRWDVFQQPGRKLQYFVNVESFPSSKEVDVAKTNFQQAADSWNELEIGLTIVETSDSSVANFHLVYAVNPTKGPGRTTLARAFFPHERDQDVIVFSKALEPRNLAILKNVFQHELGHVLGLRHEFAITGDEAKDLKAEGKGATQFMEMNYNSIMSYNFPPRMQQSDRDQTIAFYKLNNGYLMGASPVTDFAPAVRRYAKRQ